MIAKPQSRTVCIKAYKTISYLQTLFRIKNTFGMSIIIK